MVDKSALSGFWPSLYEPFRLASARLNDWLAPASEASQDKNAYKIAMELPGVAEEDIHLTVDNGVVHLRGEKKTSREEKGETWYFSERQFGSFSRSFRLPDDADEGGVKAEMKDGVLTVILPKRAPEAVQAAKRVPITRRDQDNQANMANQDNQSGQDNPAVQGNPGDMGNPADMGNQANQADQVNQR